jgi:hypothetical protein
MPYSQGACAKVRAFRFEDFSPKPAPFRLLLKNINHRLDLRTTHCKECMRRVRPPGHSFDRECLQQRLRGFSEHLRHGGCTHPQRVLGSCLGSACIAKSQRSTIAINEETQKGETLCSIRSFLAMQNARTCNLTLQTRYAFMLPKSKLGSHSLCR